MELVRRKSERGSSLLSALIASFLGVSMTMTYLQLSRYVAAKSAVDEALRAAARCLVTTDSGCAEAQAPGAGSLWDYSVNIPAHRTDVLADRYEYRANLVTAKYAAEYTTYEIPQIFEPNVQWTSFSVPVHKLQTLPPLARRIQSYERDVVHETESGYQPAANPNFPVFRDELVERPTLNSSIDSWHARYAAYSGDAFNTGLFRYASLRRPPETSSASIASFHIPKNTIETLVSDWIYVPPLESSALQQCSPGFSCGVAAAAGCASCNKSDNVSIERDGCSESCSQFVVQNLNGTAVYGLTDKFIGQAFLAIKAFAYVSAQTQTASFGWGETPNESDNGLSVEVAPSPDPRTKIQTYSLGGRLNSTGLVGGTWRNLVLRGPAGSNGGTVDHQHIGVPRGYYFRIVGRVRALNGPVNASVAILYYIDNYIKGPAKQWTTTHLCPDVEISPGKPLLDYCPPLPACGVAVTNDFRQSICRLRGEARTAGYVCSEDKTRYFAVSPVELASLPEKMRGRTYFAAMCSNPGAAGIEKDADPSDGCGPVSLEVSGTVETTLAEGSCPAAAAQMNERPCAESSRTLAAPCNGDSLPDPSKTCPWTASISESMKLAASTTDGSSPESPLGLELLAFQPVKFRWGEVKPAKPSYNTAPETVDGRAYGCARLIHHRIESAPQFLRQDPLWRPATSAFSFPLESGLSSSDESFLRALSISQIPETKEKLPIASVYPFDQRPAIEISDRLPAKPGDLNTCSGDGAVPLEERLRAYASAERKEALDPAVAFEWSATYRDTAVLEHLACGEGSGQPAENCKRTYAFESSSVCPGQTTYLGRFASDDFPAGPPVCASGQMECTRTFAGFAFPAEAPSPTFNTERAKLAGLAALNGVLGKKNAPAKTECSGSDCLSFTFDTADSPNVKVEARYQMPLLFPLDALTGQSSIEIKRERKEPVELSMLASKSAE